MLRNLKNRSVARMRIDRIEARPIVDSRGRPTIEATVYAQSRSATASVPSGKSTGSHEAVELRDANDRVDTAIANIRGEIAGAIISTEFTSLDALDAALVALDGTPDKGRLGGNAVLAVSMAAMRLSAVLDGIPLWAAIAARAGTFPSYPKLFVNVLNGGAHAHFILPFQEYIMTVPGKPADSVTTAHRLFKELGKKLPARTPIGDEGGYSPRFEAIEEPFATLAELEKGYEGVGLALDAAATELMRAHRYVLGRNSYSTKALTEVYQNLVARFSLESIEDPFGENAHTDFARLNALIGRTTLVVGDDLTVSDPVRIAASARKGEISAVLLKPNQIGTIGEALQAVRTAQRAGIRIIASHRSGETMDTFIADFAYGIGAYGIKAGGFAQEQRLAKYRRLLAIEREAEAV